MEGMIN